MHYIPSCYPRAYNLITDQLPGPYLAACSPDVAKVLLKTLEDAAVLASKVGDAWRGEQETVGGIRSTTFVNPSDDPLMDDEANLKTIA